MMKVVKVLMEELLRLLDEIEQNEKIEIDYTQVRKFIDFYQSFKASSDNQDGVLSQPIFGFDGANVEAKFWVFDILECDDKFATLLRYASKFEAEVMDDDRILIRFLIPNLFKRT